MSTDLLLEYKTIFWDAFHRPKLTTEKYQSIWNSLERINDILSGPLFSVYENGNMQYVFEDKQRFPNVHTTEDFHTWASYLINAYHDEIESVDKPVSKEEEYDLQILRFQTETKNKLLKLAVKIQQVNSK